jgi:hypothetical protein
MNNQRLTYSIINTSKPVESLPSSRYLWKKYSGGTPVVKVAKEKKVVEQITKADKPFSFSIESLV